jgi:hypothetical protein
MNKITHKILSKAAKRINKMIGATSFLSESYLSELTETQKLFIEWNAERLMIPIEECKKRFFRSMERFVNGHTGEEFDEYCELTHDVFSVLYSDKEEELYDSYAFYGVLDFLRYLSYLVPSYEANSTLVKSIGQRSKVVIVDYGCGLAQRSRALADFYVSQNVQIELHLFDIPTIRKDFLKWIYRKSSVKLTFHECVSANPIPEIPSCNVLFALEFLEHVYNPMMYLQRFHESIMNGGFLVTNVEDHKPEFMHVTPVLEDVRNHLRKLNYTLISDDRSCQIYKKP